VPDSSRGVYASTTQSPVLLIGAAHVVDLAEPLRRVLGPRTLDGVAIELDPERASALLSADSSGRRRSGGPLIARLWGLVQRRLGAEIGGGTPGAEMRAAAAVARERGLPVFLIDDPIRETLRRLVGSMPVKERVTLLVGALVGLFVPARVVEREMDRYVASPEAYAGELRRVSPTVARVLLDDRNEHMADRLADLRARGFGRLAAVVGDAHVAGLTRALHRRGIPVETVPFRDLRATTGSAPNVS
jgi:pheromone shutdown protein TraB